MTEVDKLSSDELAQATRRMVVIHRHRKRLYLYKRPSDSPMFARIDAFEIAIGAIGHRTPGGMWIIQRKALNPDWTVPDSKWAIDAGLVPGTTFKGDDPTNPIKVAFLDIWDGVGIHGTSDIGSLGKAASHGCIRMKPINALEVYHKTPVGTPCYVT